NNLGILLCDELKNYGEGIECLRKAIELDPKHAGAHYSFGVILCDHLRDYGNAAACFRKVIELSPKYADAYISLGNALQGQKKLPGAVAAYKKAIQLEPKDALAHNNLAWLLATCSDTRLRDPGLAVALAKKAVELAPQNWSCLSTLGVANYRTGD